MPNDFLKQGFKIRGGFGGSSKGFITTYYTVCVKHKDGRITEHDRITDPWRYIAKVKKSLEVEDAWVKEI